MFTQRIVEAFADDPTVITIGVLWLLDFLFGISAAVKLKSFRLSYFADTFRNDLLGKVLPYYALWAALHLTSVDFSVFGLDVIEESAGAVIIAALLGSVLNSVRDLGFQKGMSDTIAGPDPETASPPPTA